MKKIRSEVNTKIAVRILATNTGSNEVLRDF